MIKIPPFYESVLAINKRMQINKIKTSIKEFKKI